jgi:hypothetical protein
VASKQYFGTCGKNERSSSTFNFVLLLKPTSETNSDVTKLSCDSQTIDAMANSPHIPGSETSSTGRASPSPAAHTSSHSFKKPRSMGLRAISNAITGGEKANAKTRLCNRLLVQTPPRLPVRPSPKASNWTRQTQTDATLVAVLPTKEVRKKTKKHGNVIYTVHGPSILHNAHCSLHSDIRSLSIDFRIQPLANITQCQNKLKPIVQTAIAGLRLTRCTNIDKPQSRLADPISLE